MPESHRPAAGTCTGTTIRGPLASDDPLQKGCFHDTDCSNGLICAASGGRLSPVCNADECLSDADCKPGFACECGQTEDPLRQINRCIVAKCRTDADCGAGGYCSPSVDPGCGGRFGVSGLFCHRPADQCEKDECTNDSDCTGPNAWCAWDSTTERWSCEAGICAG